MSDMLPSWLRTSRNYNSTASQNALQFGALYTLNVWSWKNKQFESTPVFSTVYSEWLRRDD